MSNELQSFNDKVIAEFRANKGLVGGQMEGVPLLLLGTTGAKSGQARTNPLAYYGEDGRLFVIASYAGAASSPPWYHNLVANPQVTVEIGEETYQAIASIVDEPERTELYERIASAMPVFAEYQSKTERIIPLVELARQ